MIVGENVKVRVGLLVGVQVGVAPDADEAKIKNRTRNVIHGFLLRYS